MPLRSALPLIAASLMAAHCGGTPPTIPDGFPEGGSAVTLDGEKLRVRWSDGDSFKFLDGPYKGSGVRLMGYNTLESYGPVHRWGSWTGEELYDIARRSKYVAGSQVWACTTEGDLDAYNRVLVSCPGVVEEMIRVGFAHVFSIDEPADERMLKLQRKAQRKKWGIWEKGVPTAIVTSLHSADEVGRDGELKDPVYNRVVDSTTGMSTTLAHSTIYDICQEVCVDGTDACMTYVPFEKRYRGKPDCLRSKRK